LGFGGDVEVIEPDELRDMMLRDGLRIASTYAAAPRVLELLGVDPRRVLTGSRPAAKARPRRPQDDR
jgi:hypothetical protein